tara:strand:- start:66 stop:497 length:432 start_codon:yes stop_codon:yes gene_type:complete
MSTLLADTIRKTGGSAGVDIRIKNTSVYESDGGTSVTQNLVQGVAKAWVFIEGDGTPSNANSFNTASLTDVATGIIANNFTNNMSDDNFSTNALPMEQSFTATMMELTSSSQRSSSRSVSLSSNGTAHADTDSRNHTVHGDLA